MITPAPNWRGTGINAIAGTRGLQGFRRRKGIGQDSGNGGPMGPYDPTQGLSNLPVSGSSMNTAGEFVSPVFAAGSLLNTSVPASSQVVPGISNQTLMVGAAVALGFALLAGIAGGRR